MLVIDPSSLNKGHFKHEISDSLSFEKFTLLTNDIILTPP